jgi:hypothetical protein
MKAVERKALKARITEMAHQQFGELLKKVRFSGPFEDEDLDVDIILQKQIPLREIGRKLWNISHPLRKDGYDVLIAHEFDGRAQRKSIKRKKE